MIFYLEITRGTLRHMRVRHIVTFVENSYQVISKLQYILLNIRINFLFLYKHI